MPLTPPDRAHLRPRHRPSAKGFTLLATVAAAHDFASATDAALTGVRAALDASACTLLLIDARSEPQIILDAAPGYIRPATPRTTAVLVNAMRQQRGTLRLQVFGSDRLELKPRTSTAGDAAAELLVTPVRMDDQLLGLLSVEVDRLRRWRRHEVALVEAISAQLAQKLGSERRIRMLKRVVELARVMQVLDAQANIATSIQPLAQQSMHVLGAQGCIVALRSELAPNDMYAVGLSDAQAALLRENEAVKCALQGDALGHPICFNNLSRERQTQLDQAVQSAGFNTQLTLPLIRDAETIGFAAFLYSAGHGWSDDDIELGHVIASQMSALIANAQLYHEVHEANRLKSEFIATVSHELRTPMGAIMGYAELLASGSYGTIPDAMHDPLSRLKANADTLLLLINQMLDLSRIEAGRLELHMEPFQPADLLRAVATTAQAQLRVKSVTFESLVMDSVPSIVLGDIGRLRQMLGNLVDNGLKFTQHGAVVLRCSCVNEPSGAKLVFDVSDSGPGIPEDKLAVIWQPFRQGNGSETRSHNGAGLGLTIVHKLTELMGGTTSVTSRLGVGSTFSIRLPLHVPQH